jgi:hypothetical protein
MTPLQARRDYDIERHRGVLLAQEIGHAQSVFWARDPCQVEKLSFEFEPLRNSFEETFAESFRNERSRRKCVVERVKDQYTLRRFVRASGNR